MDYFENQNIFDESIFLLIYSDEMGRNILEKTFVGGESHETSNITSNAFPEQLPGDTLLQIGYLIGEWTDEIVLSILRLYSSREPRRLGNIQTSGSSYTVCNHIVHFLVQQPNGFENGWA